MSQEPASKTPKSPLRALSEWLRGAVSSPLPGAAEPTARAPLEGLPSRIGHHRPPAMVRLLGEADRHGNDPELFAGLVHACRYCVPRKQRRATPRAGRET